MNLLVSRLLASIESLVPALLRVTFVCLASSLHSPANAEITLSEVFYDATGADDGFEWIELHNESSAPIELGGFSIGWGGTTYLSGAVALSGIVAAGDYFVVGGPESTLDNASPVFDLAVASKGKLEEWRFLVAGTEQVDTGSGRVEAIRVERLRDNPERKTVSWHAPKYGYLPVKVEQIEPDGERLVSLLQGFTKQ